MKQSWISKVTNWMKGSGFSPVMAAGGKSLATRPCPQEGCGFKNAVGFVNDTKPGVFAVCCMKCKKKAVRERTQAGPTNPINAAHQGMQKGLKEREGKCQATTKDGDPCDNRAKEGHYCGVHKNWNVAKHPGF